MLQSVRFSLHESPRAVNGGRGWGRDDARRWLRAHGIAARSGGATENQYRFRVSPPREGAEFRTITDGLPRGVQQVEMVE